VSGIAALIHFDGAPAAGDMIRSMTGAMAHRGPDGIRHWTGGHAALGHCLLRTTAEGGDQSQPTVSAGSDLVLAMDGRTANRPELTAALASAATAFRDESDAQLLLRAYERWGVRCLDRIEGDYAFILWNQRLREAFCARDRLGHKPFFYHWNGQVLGVASEPGALLLLPWVRAQINETMLAEFLAAEFHSRTETLWHGIMRVPAAHWLIVTEKGPQTSRYWQPDLGCILEYRSVDEYTDHYLDLLTDCIVRCSSSHRPVAFEVSGGLDSSAIFCMSARLQREGRLAAPAMKGYTLQFGNDTAAYELDYAQAAAAQAGVEVREVPPTIAGPDWFRRWALRFRDFPGYPNGAMSFDLRRAAQQDHCRVVVCGLGGDEWLGGWGRRLYYGEELQAGRFLNASEWFLADWRAIGGSKAAFWLLRDGVLPLLPQTIERLLRSLKRVWRGDASGRRSLEWMSPALREVVEQKRKGREVGFMCKGPRRLRQRAQELELYAAYGAIAIDLEERMTASLGLELRFPLRDHRLVEFAFATPQRLRRRGNVDKWLHRRALADLLPAEILDRRSKADFSCVFTEQLASMERFFYEELPERRRGWIDPTGMTALYSGYRSALQDGEFYVAAGSQRILWNYCGCDILAPTS
jgi:asparagine synthase (glutamine-hydrolysing)